MIKQLNTPSCAVFEHEGLWGVLSDGAILYEADHPRYVAEAIVDLENSDNPPKDWPETRDRLVAAGIIPPLYSCDGL